MALEDQFNFTVDSLELLAADVRSSVLETEVRTCGYLQRSIENSKIIDIDVKSVEPWCAGDYKPGKSMTRCHYLSLNVCNKKRQGAKTTNNPWKMPLEFPIVASGWQLASNGKTYHRKPDAVHLAFWLLWPHDS